MGFAGWRASPLGNPYRVGRDGTLAEVLEKYRAALHEAIARRDPDVLAEFDRMDSSTKLGCWCAPRDCHCRIIKEVYEQHYWED